MNPGADRTVPEYPLPYTMTTCAPMNLGTCPDCGIFTQTLGTAPNRQFVIRWKTTYFNATPRKPSSRYY